MLTDADLQARGVGQPGRGAFTGERIFITSANVDATLRAVEVGPDGQMPNPPAIDVVAWYDFSKWPGLGGVPGGGGNVVLAGDAGLPGRGPGVFWRVARIVPGDYVKISLTSGEVLCYRVEWNKLADLQSNDYARVARATATESITLITAGRSSTERTIVSAPRAPCSQAPAPTPTRTPQPGHQQLHLVAQGSIFTLIEGSKVPIAINTVDILFDNLDRGVAHHIVVYDPTGAKYFDVGEVVGPRISWTAYMPAGPRTGAPQHYTFRCIIHPDTMRGSLTVE